MYVPLLLTLPLVIPLVCLSVVHLCTLIPLPSSIVHQVRRSHFALAIVLGHILVTIALPTALLGPGLLRSVYMLSDFKFRSSIFFLRLSFSVFCPFLRTVPFSHTFHSPTSAGDTPRLHTAPQAPTVSAHPSGARVIALCKNTTSASAFPYIYCLSFRQ